MKSLNFTVGCQIGIFKKKTRMCLNTVLTQPHWSTLPDKMSKSNIFTPSILNSMQNMDNFHDRDAMLIGFSEP